MRSSSKKLALTSVAYTVTLFAIAMMASVQLNTAAAAPNAKVALATNTLSHAAELKRMAQLKVQRLEASEAKVRSLSRADYKPSERLSGVELSRLLYHVGFQGNAHKIAWAIVMRESSGRPMAHNNNTSTGDNSYGLFQINMIGDLGADRREKFELRVNGELFDPVRNAEIAHHMSGGGSDFGSWGIGPNAYRSGAGLSTIQKWFDEYPGIVK
jgi:hypothetical protein